MLRSDQRGFTLIELLVAMLLGTVILGALFSLVTASGNANKRTSDRVDAAQRGRNALEGAVQQLRASVCLPGSVRPFVAASPTSVTWYANLDAQPYESQASPPGPTPADPDGNGDPTYDPQQRRLTYVPATAGAPSRLVEERWSTAVPVPSGTAPTSSRVLLTHLSPIGGASGPFAYGAYTDAAGTVIEPFVPGALDRIVRVDVAFTVHPTSGNRDPRISTQLRNSVHARVVNRTVNPPTYGCTT